MKDAGGDAIARILRANYSIKQIPGEHEEILRWFGDWELLDPGLVPLPEWRPDIAGQAVRDSTYHGFVGGVARKP